MTQKILIADDDSDILAALEILLKSEGYTPLLANSPEMALEKLRLQQFDLVLMDLNYARDTTSGEEGLSLICKIRETEELIPIVVMTGWGTINIAVNSIKSGANDFVQKPWDNQRLVSIIKTQLELTSSRKQSEKLLAHNQLLRAEADTESALIFDSELMKQSLKIIHQVANTDASVLFTGENGTGKSLFARYLHSISLRKDGPLVSVNMGAIPESLFESEMFGHIKGAFTDAKSNRVGRFELADKGTLFLDEIANIPYSQQGKLLRVLEDRQFEKVGSSKTQYSNVRLITATNANLKQRVKDECFREDLLYRVNTVEIEIPPLRRRKKDIVPLAEAFLKKIASKYSQADLTLDKSAIRSLQSYHWPGNVRELSHIMERAHILCQDSCIRDDILGLKLEASATQGSGAGELKGLDSTDLRPLDKIESDIIASRLDHFKGDALQTAESLGLSRSALYRRLEKLKT